VEQGGGGYTAGGGNAPVSNAEAMRMEAIKAENERKAKQAEQGLPAFPTQAEAVPLRKNSSPQYYYETDEEDDQQIQQTYRDDSRSVSEGPRRQGTGYTARRQASGDTNVTTNYAGRARLLSNPGYIPLPPGRNPVDLYNNNSSPASNIPPRFPSSPPLPNSYPPQTHAQSSASYSVSTSPPPMPVGGVTHQSQYLTPSGASPAVSRVYGHGPQESSCESSASFLICLDSYVIVRIDQSAYSHQPGYSSHDPYGSTNPYTVAGVGRQPAESLYFTAQNTHGIPSQTQVPPMPTVYPNTPSPPLPQPPLQPQPQPQAYNPFAQHMQNPTQYPAPEQGHVAAPWHQAGRPQRQPTMPMPNPTPAQSPQQNMGVPNEAPPGYDYGVPGGYR